MFNAGNSSNHSLPFFDRMQLKEQLFPASATKVKKSTEEKGEILEKLAFVKNNISSDYKQYKQYVRKDRANTWIFVALRYALFALFVLFLSLGIIDLIRTASFNLYLLATLIVFVLVAVTRFVQPFFVSSKTHELCAIYRQTTQHLENLAYVVQYAESISDCLTLTDVNALYLACHAILENTHDRESSFRSI